MTLRSLNRFPFGLRETTGSLRVVEPPCAERRTASRSWKTGNSCRHSRRPVTMIPRRIPTITRSSSHRTQKRLGAERHLLQRGEHDRREPATDLGLAGHQGRRHGGAIPDHRHVGRDGYPLCRLDQRHRGRAIPSTTPAPRDQCLWSEQPGRRSGPARRQLRERGLLDSSTASSSRARPPMGP